MYRLYEKNELNFALTWIAIYLVLSIASENFSALLQMQKVISAPVLILLALLLFCWIKKHKLSEKYGLCALKGNPKHYLYFIPLLLLMTVNLWNGVQLNYTVTESVLYVVSMLCVGFLEEIIFRGFLFKAICKDNEKQAIAISAITFGMGHIVSLLNGKDIALTLLQICYATAIGLLFTIIFYKGKSLLPCIITHGILNSLSCFRILGSLQMHIVTAVVLCVFSIGYTLWILRSTGKAEKAG